MLFRSLVAIFGIGLALEVLASPLLHDKNEALSMREVPSTHTVHERHSPQASSAAWTKRSKVPRGTVLPMRIGLTQSNLDIGHDRLMAV